MRHLKPEEIKEHWPKVRKGLERIGVLNPDYMPEDVYRHCMNGTAQLSLIAEDGFMVWQKYPGDDGRGMLFILALAAYEDNGLLRHYKQSNEEVNALAAEVGCKRLRHISPHEEWASLGWTHKGHVFEREL